jgi:hypothetical protein
VALYRSGTATNECTRKACEELVKLDGGVEFQDILEVGLALFLMWELDPKRFTSDRAFRFQLVRRIRCLGDVNVGVYWNANTNSQRRVYRNFRPRPTMILSDMLVKFFARAAGHVIYITRKEAEERAAIDAAFEELTGSPQ